MAPRFKPYQKDSCQSQLFATNVFDLLPEDHECFLYQELFAQLDTSEVEARYSHRGQRAYAPRQIISILIYAYSHGVFSSRIRSSSAAGKISASCSSPGGTARTSGC